MRLRVRSALAAAVTAALALGFAGANGAGKEGDWRSYGGDPGGRRYSALAEIDRGNVGRLKRAWTYHTGDLDAPSSVQPPAFESTPLAVAGVLFVSTQSGGVIALDGDRLVYEVAGCRYVQAIAGSPRQVGDEIVVALRPEKVEIRKGPRPEDGGNGIAGEISAWNYHGTSFHVLVETAALGELIVTAPAWHSEVEPEVGRRVHLVWSADAAGVVAPD